MAGCCVSYNEESVSYFMYLGKEQGTIWTAPEYTSCGHRSARLFHESSKSRSYSHNRRKLANVASCYV